MRLADQQVDTFVRQGWLLLPAVFSAAEVETMKRELHDVLQAESPARVLEKDAATVRSVYGAHVNSPVFAALTRHPRLLNPARQILADDVYVHQFKINAKAALGDGSWSWHQDYIFWLHEDGMPDARALNVAVFLDEVTEFNGPLFLIPGSQREGVIETPVRELPADGETPYADQPGWIANLIADLKYSLDRESIRRLVAEYGLVAPKGPAGSVLFFHCNIAHCSGPNMSPFDRALALVTYNSVTNALRPVAQPRPQFLASRDATPLAEVPEHALRDAGESRYMRISS